MESRAVPPRSAVSRLGSTPPPKDLASFYEQVFLPLVRRAVWRHGLPKEDARDVVQDAFVLAIEKIDLGGNPRAWLIQVVDHLCLNHTRKAHRRAHLTQKWGKPKQEGELQSNSAEEM